ncbi:hypothetical protein HOY80DRAFT_1001015 [Tuber brumale]|nr:hypothetical protein HOY80DRAFT_1001015 [Tuber brumale]
MNITIIVYGTRILDTITGLIPLLIVRFLPTYAFPHSAALSTIIQYEHEPSYCHPLHNPLLLRQVLDIETHFAVCWYNYLTPSQLPFSPFLTIISIHRNCTALIVFNLRHSKLISIKTASSCVTPGLPFPISRTSIHSTQNSQLSPLELCLILYLLILHRLPIYSGALSNIYHEIISTAELRTELNLNGRGGTVASRRYRDVRKFILRRSRERRVTSKRQAGEDTWNDLKSDAVSHPSLRGFQAKFDSPHMGPFANFHRALDSLILDVHRKAAESRRAARINSDDEEERSVTGPSGTQPEAVVCPPPTIYEEKPFKIIYIETTATPQGTACLLPRIVPVGGVANWNWLGVLKYYTLQELGKAACKHLDDGEHPRKLVGILKDIQPLNGTPDGTHQVELIDDDQVNAWVHLSNARPLTVACFLHCAPAAPPDGPPDAPLVRLNTPLARRRDRYLEPGQFDVAKFYTKPAGDSELEDDLAYHTKRRKGFPRSDSGWRRRIQTNDRRRQSFGSKTILVPGRQAFEIQSPLGPLRLIYIALVTGKGNNKWKYEQRARAAISRFSPPSASALRSSLSVIDVDFPSHDEAPLRHRRVQKRSVEDYSQHQQRAKRLRFLTADSPSPALTGPTSPFSSPSQQAQIHSGHRRVNSPHFTPLILGSQPILTHQNGCQTAEEDNSASDIVDTVTSLSDRSNFMRGEERIVFENAANMVRYHTWFVNPFVKPSENDSLLESYWVKGASKLGWAGLAMQKHAMTFDFYDLLHKQPAEIRVKVSYLLEDDRFTYHPSKQEAWSTGTFVQPPDFSALAAQNVYLRQRATWQRLPVVVQKKLVEDTKKRIKRLLCDNGFVQEHESRAAPEDPDAAAYLVVQVSGDEESVVEDNNSYPEAEDVIDALVEGPAEEE